MHFLPLLLLISFFFPAGAHAANCVRVVQDGLAELIENPETKLALSINDVFASPAPEPGSSFFSIITNRKTYRVSNEIVRPIKLKNCFDQPMCVVTKADTKVRKSVPPATIIQVQRGDKFLAVANKEEDANTIFLMRHENQYYWIDGKAVSIFINKTCEEVTGNNVADAVTEGAAKASKYSFGFEAGAASGYKSGAYDAFITEVPDPSNVGPLSNPIVTEVKKGAGFFIGPLLEINFAENFKTKLGVFYQENIFKWVGKENPTIASNSLDSLPDTSGTLKNQSLVFAVAPSFEFGGTHHRGGLGVTVRTHYYISKPSTITYRVGTVFKGNEVVVEAGPQGFETFGYGHLYYQWYPGENSPFALRATVETDGTTALLGLSAFY